MDPSQESYDGLNTAYMNMLNRNIPGVGNNPLNTTTTTKPTHLTNKTKDTTSATATTLLTQNQRHAIDTLQAAIKDAFYVSEGEEPYQTVHITTTTTTGATGATALKKTTTSFPTEQEFVTLLHATQLLPSFQQQQQQQQQVQEDEDEGNTCEKSSNLQSILNTSNPGSDKLAKALQDVFGYCSSSSSTEANTTTTTTAAAAAAAATTTAPKDDKMVLYRVADPSSSTKVHIWVLGWIDNDLIGLHTISIES